MKTHKTQELKKVATRDDAGKLRWLSWKALPSLQHYKKLYRTNKERFIEIDGTLYIKDFKKGVDVEIHKLFLSCLQLAGSRYALALILSGGDRKSDTFNRVYKNLSNGNFSNKIYWYDAFESVIKQRGIRAGIINDGKVSWFELDESYIQTNTLKGYYSSKPFLFEKIDNILYFLPTQNILLENMFFRCVEIAGGEYKLAAALGKTEKTRNRHLKNFERFNFKHDENFKTYMKLFSEYLRANQTLLAEEPIYA